MYKCETCNKPHEGTFATGRFCSRSCSNSFSTKNKRSEINKKVGEKLKGRSSKMKGVSLKTGKPLELRKCLNCEKEIDARKSYCNRKCLMEFHRAAKTSFQNYRLKASFNFNVYDYPDYFNLQLIEEHGIYRAKNRGDNLEGVVRDHMLSVKEGFMNNIDPEILAHPANCALIQHRDNCSKNSKSSITISELLDRIKEFEKIKNMTKYTHGIATAVKEILTSEGKIEVNSQGIITAYLPDYDKFAVDFGNGQWIAFDRVSFDKYCKIS